MTSCRCGATWGGHTAQHCCACHATFSGTTAGDMHRVGDHAVSTGPDRRRCLTVAEMTERGMSLGRGGIWGTGRGQGVRFWLAQEESAGFPGVPEGDVLAVFSGALEIVESMEGTG